MGLCFDDNGKYLGWSNLFNYDNEATLEASEKLEQLRYLEYGKRIKMVETSHGSIGIDTPEDLARARKLL